MLIHIMKKYIIQDKTSAQSNLLTIWHNPHLEYDLSGFTNAYKHLLESVSEDSTGNPVGSKVKQVVKLIKIQQMIQELKLIKLKVIFQMLQIINKSFLMKNLMLKKLNIMFNISNYTCWRRRSFSRHIICCRNLYKFLQS